MRVALIAISLVFAAAPAGLKAAATNAKPGPAFPTQSVGTQKARKAAATSAKTLATDAPSSLLDRRVCGGLGLCSGHLQVGAVALRFLPMRAYANANADLKAAATNVTAQDVAHALEAHYRRTKTMSAVFLETYKSGAAGMRAESGKVYFSRPGRMRWDYDSPEKKLFLVDGKNVWYYVPADHTASRTSVKQSSDWRTPLALLAGKVNLEKLCGSLKLAPATEQLASRASDSHDAPQRVTEAGNEVLACTPRKEDQDAFTEVFFEVNPRNQLTRVTIRQAGDIETEFRFGDWRENIPIAETEFHFAPPTGVATVDDASLATPM